MRTNNILLVEDNPDISLLIQMGLATHGFDVTVAANAEDALSHLSSDRILDLILLDIMLPTMNGMEMIPIIRQYTDVPVIIVSAKDTVRDKVVGIDTGADDYISKPFHMEELLVRVKAQLRRRGHIRNGGRKLKVGSWILDPNQLQAFSEKGTPARLSPNEYYLLQRLASEPNKIFTREQLLSLTRDSTSDVADRVIDTQLARIKAKLGKEELIKSIRGIGYMFVGQVSDDKTDED